MYNSNGTIISENFNYDIFENNFKIQTQKWSEYLLNQPSLTDSLIEFCAKRFRCNLPILTNIVYIC